MQPNTLWVAPLMVQRHGKDARLDVQSARLELLTHRGLAGCRKGVPLLHGATTFYTDDEDMDAGPCPRSCANQQGTFALGGQVQHAQATLR